MESPYTYISIVNPKYGDDEDILSLVWKEFSLFEFSINESINLILPDDMGSPQNKKNGKSMTSAKKEAGYSG